MINERHHAASDRLLTYHLLDVLYEVGFRYLAIEAVYFGDQQLNNRGYVTTQSGTYTAEPVFAALIRKALSLGYEIIPYEIEPHQRIKNSDLSAQQLRDRAQAQNIVDRTIRTDPNARVLVHAGYAHIWETKTDNWSPMALYFKDLTGIDPLTIDQTLLSERGSEEFEHSVYRKFANSEWVQRDPVVLHDENNEVIKVGSSSVDLEVLTPRTRYDNGRPTWLDMGGTRTLKAIETPECVKIRCFVAVRREDAIQGEIPFDIVEASFKDFVVVYLPDYNDLVFELFTADSKLIRREIIVAEDHDVAADSQVQPSAN